MPSRYDHGPGYRLSFGGPFTPAVKWLIISNVAVFVVELFVVRSPSLWDLTLSVLALSPAQVFTRGMVWQLLTYMFLHSPDSIFHILFNMLVLWMFGGEIERLWGPRRFLRYYLTCGVGGGLTNCAFAFLQSQTVGASGAIFGVIIAYGMLFPTRTILFWGIFPMTARQLAILLAVIELVSLGALTPAGVARFAHLGGALTGYLLIKGTWSPRGLYEEVRWRIRRRRFRTVRKRGAGRFDRDRRYPFH